MGQELKESPLECQYLHIKMHIFLMNIREGITGYLKDQDNRKKNGQHKLSYF